MTIALIDNGSLEPAAHAHLRAVAAALSARTGATVHAVSWKHSDRIPATQLSTARPDHGVTPAHTWTGPAWTLLSFVRAYVAAGENHFLFVPFFISPQGAIGSALAGDLAKLQLELGGFEFAMTAGLAERGVLPSIVADRVRTAGADAALVAPPVVVVDHGGPSPVSADLRDRLAAEIARLLDGQIGPLAAASMEGRHPPWLADQLRAPGFAQHDVVVAPLFLSPGRHAGPGGDIAQICAASGTRCHVTELVGNHPLAVDALAAALHDSLSTLHVSSSA